MASQDFVKLDQETLRLVVDEGFGGNQNAAFRAMGLPRGTGYRILHGDVKQPKEVNQTKFQSLMRAQSPLGADRPKYMQGQMLNQDRAELRHIQNTPPDGKDRWPSDRARNRVILDYLDAAGLDPGDPQVYEQAFGHAKGSRS